MFNKNKIIVFLLITLLILSGCGKDTNNNSSSNVLDKEQLHSFTNELIDIQEMLAKRIITVGKLMQRYEYTDEWIDEMGEELGWIGAYSKILINHIEVPDNLGFNAKEYLISTNIYLDLAVDSLIYGVDNYDSRSIGDSLIYFEKGFEHLNDLIIKCLALY